MNIEKLLVIIRIIIGLAVLVLGVFVKLGLVAIINPANGIMLLLLGFILTAWALFPLISRRKS